MSHIVPMIYKNTKPLCNENRILLAKGECFTLHSVTFLLVVTWGNQNFPHQWNWQSDLGHYHSHASNTERTGMQWSLWSAIFPRKTTYAQCSVAVSISQEVRPTGPWNTSSHWRYLSLFPQTVSGTNLKLNTSEEGNVLDTVQVFFSIRFVFLYNRSTSEAILRSHLNPPSCLWAGEREPSLWFENLFNCNLPEEEL